MFVFYFLHLVETYTAYSFWLIRGNEEVQQVDSSCYMFCGNGLFLHRGFTVVDHHTQFKQLNSADRLCLQAFFYSLIGRWLLSWWLLKKMHWVGLLTTLISCPSQILWAGRRRPAPMWLVSLLGLQGFFAGILHWNLDVDTTASTLNHSFQQSVVTTCVQLVCRIITRLRGI